MQHADGEQRRQQIACDVLVSAMTKNNAHLPTSASGFTLVEVLVAMSILAILVAIAIPSFRQITAAQRMRSVSSDIVSDLVIARNEAVKRGQNVVLAPVSAGWPGGWTLAVSSDSTLLSARSAVGSGVTFAAAPVNVTYDRYGRLSGATSVVRFALTTSGSTQARCVSIDPSGRPKSSASACPT